MEANQKQFEWLNIIRVLGVLLIFLCHYSVSYQQYNISGFHNYFLWFGNFDSGKVGVYLFFIISAFGLSFKYSNTEFKLLEFYKSRWLKLFPLFYLSYLFFYLVKLVQGHNIITGNYINIIWTFFGFDAYISQIIPTFPLVGEWFTGAIIVLYIIFPILLKLSKKSVTFYTTSGILLLLFSLNCYYFTIPYKYSVESIFIDLFSFWLGIFLFNKMDQMKKVPILFAVVAIVPLLLVKNIVDIRINCLIISLLSFVIISKFSYENLKNNRIYQIVLKNAYGIYLVHHMTIYFFMEKLANRHISFINGIFLGIGIFFVTCIIAVLLNFICKKLIKTIFKISGITNLTHN